MSVSSEAFDNPYQGVVDYEYLLYMQHCMEQDVCEGEEYPTEEDDEDSIRT